VKSHDIFWPDGSGRSRSKFSAFSLCSACYDAGRSNPTCHTLCRMALAGQEINSPPFHFVLRTMTLAGQEINSPPFHFYSASDDAGRSNNIPCCFAVFWQVEQLCSAFVSGRSSTQCSAKRSSALTSNIRFPLRVLTRCAT
jgi:hypothetical protein